MFIFLHMFIFFNLLQMDDLHYSQREQHRLLASFARQETAPTPDYREDARGSTRAAAQQTTKKKEEELEKRIDSAPSIHSFVSASVLMSDKATCASGEDKVNTSLIFHP